MAQKTSPNHILQELKKLSKTADETIKEISIPEPELNDWFSIIKAAALQIFNDEQSEKIEVPKLVSFLQPSINTKKKSLQSEAGREHIHRAKSIRKLSKNSKKLDSDVIIGNHVKAGSSLNFKDSAISVSEDVTFSDSKDANSLNSKEVKFSYSKSSSSSNSKHAAFSSSKGATFTSEKIYTIEENAEENSQSRLFEQNQVVAQQEQCEPVTISKNSTLLKKIPETWEKTDVSNHITPKNLENATLGCFTQVLDKKFKSVCSDASYHPKVNPQDSVLQPIEKESLKTVASLKEQNTVSEAEEVKIIQDENPVSLLATQKQKSGNILKLVLPKKPTTVKKEKEKFKELKAKEEKASENLQKLLTLRQIKLQENKRKREEKLELAAEKRQKIEKEKEVQMKKHCKHDASSASKAPLRKSLKKKLLTCPKKSKENKTKLNKEKDKADVTMIVESPKKLHNITTVLKDQNSENVKSVSYSKIKAKLNKEKDTPKNDTTMIVESSKKMHNITTTLKSGNSENVSNETESKYQEFAVPAVSKLKKTPPLMALKSKNNDFNIPRTPESQSLKEVSSYDMTPAREDGNSDDSGDERERRQHKKIPTWAQGTLFKHALIDQHYNPRNPDEIFGTAIDPPDLTVIFKVQKHYYVKRTSSAIWHAPLS